MVVKALSWLRAEGLGRRRPGVALASIVALAACGSCVGTEPKAPAVPHVTLVAAHGAPLDVLAVAQRARLTVLVFFSPHCHCLDIHEPRLLALEAALRSSDVQILMIDSEVGGSVERDEAEATARHYPFPIVLDRGAKLADAVGARYATYSVVIDGDGRVRYRGNIDSDNTHLRQDAIPYLRNAIDELLAGRAPRAASGEGFGCALQTW
jgi:redoxin